MSTVALPAGVKVIERGWLSSNVVLLSGPAQRTVIDSGYWTHAAQTVSLVQAALGSDAPELLLNTHLHSDHCGGNAALQARFPGLRTLIPPGQARSVAHWDTDALSYGPTGQHCPRFEFHELLQPGSERQLGGCTWEIHAAAGHDPHSVILFEPQTKTLVSADALWENGFGIVFPELEGEEAFDAVAATLTLIEKLAPRTVIPGHGTAFAYSDAVVQRARERLAAFVLRPAKHARHAAKVLLKFKLLELQGAGLMQFLQWARETPYFEMVRQRFFADEELDAWIEALTDELIASGAAQRNGLDIFNA
jgi:glyoxylase-like metal-dependent hydrolase (beta-lactamase superfamily II)